ncbi:Ribonuclease H-like protein [Glarea lozoyensis ATCC 20868]|uniref:Ribonuclease H-like protein n=1 Tax=Glarea lozoyensis (strain ATCC 20868 / MF5171) TaxID=1116229 RepID=S3CP67_GLAL2|nr:Ribonuclease H-like protein [Glarea lozoyensis ATCC 20868]EPE27505.1 Ribonuclease H-like protein [Glarea lozoyensis ATCC 20868]
MREQGDQARRRQSDEFGIYNDGSNSVTPTSVTQNEGERVDRSMLSESEPEEINDDVQPGYGDFDSLLEPDLPEEELRQIEEERSQRIAAIEAGSPTTGAVLDPEYSWNDGLLYNLTTQNVEGNEEQQYHPQDWIVNEYENHYDDYNHYDDDCDLSDHDANNEETGPVINLTNEEIAELNDKAAKDWDNPQRRRLVPIPFPSIFRRHRSRGIRSANCRIPRRIRRMKSIGCSVKAIHIRSRSARSISRLCVRVPKHHNVVHVLYKRGRNVRGPGAGTTRRRRTVCHSEELSKPLPELNRKVLVLVAGRPLVWLIFSRNPLIVPSAPIDFYNGYHPITGAPRPGKVTWIEDMEDFRKFLPYLSEIRASDNPELALDCESSGCLNRNGNITHLTMTVKSMDHTWVLCKNGIPDNYFDIANDEGVTLRSILENQDIIQLWFDVRGDSDAIHGLYNIRLGNVIDIQLMELATRYADNHQKIVGLGKAVGQSGHNFMSQLALNKWLWAKREGGSHLGSSNYQTLNQHPLPLLEKMYVAGDTHVLFGLHDVYIARYPIIQSAYGTVGKEVDLAEIVKTQSMLRVHQSESPGHERGEGFEMQGAPRVFRDLEWVWSDGTVKRRQMPGPSLEQHSVEPTADEFAHLNEENILQATQGDGGGDFLLDAADQGSLYSQETELGIESEEDGERAGQLQEEVHPGDVRSQRDDVHHGDNQSSHYWQRVRDDILPEEDDEPIGNAVRRGNEWLEGNEGLYYEPSLDPCSDRHQQEFKPEFGDEQLDEAFPRSHRLLNRNQDRHREQAFLEPLPEQHQHESIQEETGEQMSDEDPRNSLWLESLGMVPQSNAWLQRLEEFNNELRTSKRPSEQWALETPPVELIEPTEVETAEMNHSHEIPQQGYETPQASAAIVDHNEPAEEDQTYTCRPRGIRRLVNRFSTLDLRKNNPEPTNQPTRRRSFMRLKALVDPNQNRLARRASSFFRPKQPPQEVPREVPANIFGPRTDGHLPRSSSYANNPAWLSVFEAEQARLGSKTGGLGDEKRTGSVRQRVKSFYMSGRRSVSEFFTQT